jgi:adenylosuccinate lyase
MIERYKTDKMSNIFDDQNRFKYWLDVEIAVCKSWNSMGKIPNKDLREIIKKANFNIDRINKIEEETNHDVIAFLTNVSEYVGDSSRFIHMGMTSSDMLDTALALQLNEALEELIKCTEKLAGKIYKQAETNKYIPVIGRTHGIHAEPTTIGLKLLSFYAEIDRDIKRLKRAKDEISTGKISGAVGNYANLPPEVEERALDILGLHTDSISTQVISRDRHAYMLSAIAILGGTLERIAINIRNMQRTEIGEFEEPFKKGQKGSSAMPHKRNPIMCERIVGMSRLLRANGEASMENIALWDERDISHSSVERVIIPDSFHLVHYMIKKMIYIVDNLYINKKNIERNLKFTNGLIFSQRLLLKLIINDTTREDAYKFVQTVTMKAYKENRDLQEITKSDNTIASILSDKEIDECFDVSYYLKYVDYVFKRVKERE